MRKLLLIILFSILPCLPQDFKFSVPADTAVISAAAVFAFSGALISRKQTAPDAAFIESLNVNDLPAFDRQAVFNHSKSAKNTSDAALGVSILLPYIYSAALGHTKGTKTALSSAGVYSESMIFSAALNAFIKTAAHRRRPLLYSSKVSLQEKQALGKTAIRSFYSGHTSAAACAASFTAVMLMHSGYNQGVKFSLSLTGYSLAAAVAVLRVRAGMHFPSDVIAGYAAGSICGLVIPLLHLERRKDSISAEGNSAAGAPGFKVSFRF